MTKRILFAAAATALLLVLSAPARADDCAAMRAKLDQLEQTISRLRTTVNAATDEANADNKMAQQFYDAASTSNKKEDWDASLRMEQTRKAALTNLSFFQKRLAGYESDAADLRLLIIAANCENVPPPTKANSPAPPDNPAASPSSAGGTNTTAPTIPPTQTADTPVPTDPNSPTIPNPFAPGGIGMPPIFPPSPLPPVQVGPTNPTTASSVAPPSDSGGSTDQPPATPDLQGGSGPQPSPSPSPAPLPVAALPPITLPAPGPSSAGNLPATWCVMQRPGADGNPEQTVILCTDSAGAGPGWMPVASNLTFVDASRIRDGFNNANLPPVWCVMRNGTQMTVIRCDNTAGAGPGWITQATNQTWPAANRIAFGTPSAAGGSGPPPLPPVSIPPVTPVNAPPTPLPPAQPLPPITVPASAPASQSSAESCNQYCVVAATHASSTAPGIVNWLSISEITPTYRPSSLKILRCFPTELAARFALCRDWKSASKVKTPPDDDDWTQLRSVYGGTYTAYDVASDTIGYCEQAEKAPASALQSANASCPATHNPPLQDVLLAPPACDA